MSASIGTPLVNGYVKFVDSDGSPLANGTAAFFLAGTSTPVITYANEALGAANTAVIDLDSEGGALIWLDASNGTNECVSLKLLLKDADGVTLPGYPVDGLPVFVPAAGGYLSTAVLGYGATTTLTISGGAITPTKNIHALNPEGAAPDDLTTVVVTNIPDGGLLILSNASGSAAITVKTGTGNIFLSAGDYVMSTTAQRLVLVRDGASWFGVDRPSGVGDFVGPASSTDNAAVRFDGTTGKLGQTSLLIVSDVGLASVPAGTGSGTTTLAGTLTWSVTSTGNSGTAETDLWTYTTPASTLAVNGDAVEMEAWGTGDTGADVKTLRFYWAGVQITAMVGDGSPAGTFPSWFLNARVVRVGATSQVVTINASEGLAPKIAVTTGTATLSSTNIIKVTGQGASSNQLVFKYGRITFWPHSL